MNATDPKYDTELPKAIIAFQDEIKAQQKKDVPNLAVIHYCELNIKNLRDERINLKIDQQLEES